MASHRQSRFFAKQVTHRKFDIAANINARSGGPAIANRDGNLCTAGFRNATANAKLSRQQINAYMDGQQFENMTRKILGVIINIHTVKRFSLAGFTGIEVTGQPRLGPDAANTRLFMSIVETRKGRMTLACATKKSSLPAALVQFRSIRATITLPQ